MCKVKRGVDVPSPKLPKTESQVNCVATPTLPKRTVEDAERPPVRSIRVDVEFAVVPKLVVVVNGNELPLTRQLLLIEKQPPLRLTPYANVDVAVVDATLSNPTESPPANVEVAFVDVAR